MYYEIYNIISNFIFGASQLTNWQEIYLAVLSSICVTFVILVPFYVVWRVICIIIGR